MLLCPDKHESQASDYCSVCGMEMQPSVPSQTASAAELGGGPCPLCHTERHPGGGIFCEECGYNFKEGASSAASLPAAVPTDGATRNAAAPASPTVSVPVSPTEAAPSPDTAPSLAAETERPSARLSRWELVAVVDPMLFGKLDLEAPEDRTERIFPLDLDEQLIGRRSARRNINPEICLNFDDGVSHRQAKILRQADGRFAVLDLGSSNGTLLNGKEIPANVLTPLAENDQLCVGRWTRMTFRPRL